MRVERTLAGDDKVGTGNAVREIEGFGDELEAGMKFGIEEVHHSETESTSCSGTGFIGEILSAGDLDEVCEESFEDFLLGGGGAFLRSEDGGGAIGTEDGVVDIAGDINGREIDELRAINDREIVETGGAGGERFFFRVEEKDAEGVGEANSAIVGGAPADSDEDALDAFLGGGVADHQAGAVGGGLEDVAIGSRDEFKAGGGGHFHDGKAGVGDGVAGFDGAVEGIDGVAFHPLSTKRGKHGGGEAFSAVGDGAEIDLSGFRKPVFNGLGYFRSGERAFEFVVGNEDAHVQMKAGQGPSQLADEANAERIAVGDAVVGFDGCDDGEDEVEDNDNGDENNTDEYQDQEARDDDVKEHRQLEVQGLFRLVTSERHGVLFDLPHDEGGDDIE